MARVLSVNVGPAIEFRAGRARRSAIVKVPVEGAVAVRAHNVDGDEQADTRHHGGPDQAVYAYARESYAWWERELGRTLEPGAFGENLTLEGIDVDGALIGERWAVGDVVLEVTAPRIACAKLAKRIGEPAFVKRFGVARRPGAYLRVVEDGTLAAGDEVRLLARPAHGVDVGLVNEVLLFDREAAATLLPAAGDLSVRVAEWVRDSAARTGAE